MAAPPGAYPWSTLVINLTGCLLIGGAVGAVWRYPVGRLVIGHSERGTFAVNVAGWLLLGLLSGLGTGLSGWLGDPVGVGFCGALTTWSTFAYETVLLRRRPALYAGATLVVGVAAATVGAALG